MKLVKKGICFALAITMGLSLCACSKDKAANSDGTVTVKWIMPQSDQPDGGLIQEAVSEISREKIGAGLEIQYIDQSSYKERMTMMMASSAVFDICFTGYLNPYENAVRNGSFLELDELLETEAQDLVKAIPDYGWKGAKINGKIYGVPNLQAAALPVAFMVFNDVAEKYNFDPTTVKKPEDLEPLLKAVTENEPNMYAVRTHYGVLPWVSTKYQTILNWLYIPFDGSSTKVELKYNVPEYKQGIATLYDWFQKGYIRQDVLSAGSDEQDANAGRYAVTFCRWLPSAEGEAAVKYGREVSDIPLTQAVITSTMGTGDAISVDSKHPVEAIKMIELVNTDKEVFNILKLGIKDKHYTLDEEGKYSLIEGSGYRSPGGWTYGNDLNSLVAVGQELDVWEQTKKLNDEAAISPLLGFVPNTDSIKTKITQVDAIVGEYGDTRLAVTNFKDGEELLKRLEAAGVNEIIAEIQKQVDEFLAANAEN